MFAELESLLAERTLIITVSRAEEGQLRVNVIPKPRGLKENDSGETALTTPLTMTGSAEELDRGLAAQLIGFAASVAETGSSLAQVRAAHQAAVKAVEAENKKALDAKRKTTPPGVAKKPEENPAGPLFKDGKPVFGSKGGGVSGTAPSLFAEEEEAREYPD